MRKRVRSALLATLLMSLAACAPKIYGTVQLIDMNNQPIPVTKESPQGTVVNMIATTGAVEAASHAVIVDAEGKYESEKKKIEKGVYKVEASRIGFVTETQTVQVGGFGGKKVEFKLKKIHEGKRKTIEGSKSDEDKIINPGEVNIQPPTM
jgi:type IV pilus biogenesis protein CpaD/CtpE